MAKVTIKQLNDSEKKEKGIASWPIWEKEISRFEWYYDSKEFCQILEGEVTVHTDEGDYHFKAGDFVIFEKELKCVWNVKKPVRKHYKFE
ncbi:MAG: cupin [Bacteroidetes bacterium RIFOXYA12_FULL_35_11]|nr:MAG: cupin [Bacteroidetes bacterium GWF2_35_48]OFY81675.1 MAG: cupin [Bacteroidetes bacterium RIFOXYA12_FULL_35_11]HBX50249.1 cupin [Bacteroidales bacterium]